MRLDVFLTTFDIELISAVAYAILVAAGSLLWKRGRTHAAMLIAVGFALALLFEIASLVERWEFVARLRGNSNDTFFIVEHHAYWRYLALLGLCLAAVGLMWHAISSGKHGRVP